MFRLTTRPNLYDYLKIAAIVVMIIDHAGFFLWPEVTELRVIGRLAFPVFLFLVGLNGFYRRSRPLWICGIIAQFVRGLWASYVGWFDRWIIQILLVIAVVRVVLSGLQYTINGILPWMARSIVVGLGVLLLIINIYVMPYADYGTMALVWALVGFWYNRGWSYGYIGLVMAGVFQLLFQHIIFGSVFVSAHRYALIIGYIGLVWVLHRVSAHNDTLSTSHTILDNILIWFSSKALWIYIAHLVILAGVAYVLGIGL